MKSGGGCFIFNFFQMNSWYNKPFYSYNITSYTLGFYIRKCFITFIWCSPCCPLSYFYQMNEYPPHTSTLSFLCSQTLLRQGCKAADLLWFSRTRRRQTERQTVREGKGRILSSCLWSTLVSLRTCVFFPGPERCGERKEEGVRRKERQEHPLHIDEDLVEKEGKRG